MSNVWTYLSIGLAIASIVFVIANVAFPTLSLVLLALALITGSVPSKKGLQ